MKNKKSDEIVGKIEEVYGTLSENDRVKKVYASVSWCGRLAKPEIRTIMTTKQGEQIIAKGINITDDEMENLIKAYRNKKQKEEANKPVNFDAIFGKAPDILDKREDGSVTENGFIVLRETKDLKRHK